MIKKVTSTIALLAITGAISFASYSAVVDNKTELESANNLAMQDIINDHKEDPINYNLAENVLRQEIAAVARGVAKLDKKAKCDNIFDDLSASNPNTWACINVEVLVDNDLISENDNFRPEDNITKAETIAMLIKAIGFDYEMDENSGKDWKEQVVDYAIKKGVVEDFSDYGTDATRGWVFQVADTTIRKDVEIKAAIKKIEEEEKEKGTYTNEASF